MDDSAREWCVLAALACDSPRYRCHSHPLALVLISHDPDAARGALRSFGSRLLNLSLRLAAWIDEEYHQRVHSSTSQRPLKRYLAHMEALRPAPKDLWDYFRVPARRKVDKDRTVSLNGTLFEAPVGLIGKTVTLLYHKNDPKRVEVLLDEKSHGFLMPLNVGINSRVRRGTRQNSELVFR